MQLQDFYELSARYARGVAWFKPRDPSVSNEFLWNLFSGGAEDGPIEFRIMKAKNVFDVIPNSASVLIVSERTKNLFAEAGFTGWRSFPVRLYDQKDQLLQDAYSGIAVVGRAGRLDEEHSVAEWALGPDGRRAGILAMNGIHFDVAEWDGSDIFMLEDKGYILVTSRVIGALREGGISGWKATPVLDYGRDED